MCECNFPWRSVANHFYKPYFGHTFLFYYDHIVLYNSVLFDVCYQNTLDGINHRWAQLTKKLTSLTVNPLNR